MLPLFLVVLLGYAIASPIPIIIDTDIGDDFDDSWAITEAISRPDIWEVKLILTAAKNTHARAQIVAKYLIEYKRTDIPIGIGVQTEDGFPNLYPWAADIDLNKYNQTGGTVYADGIAAAAYVIGNQPAGNPIRIIALAPTTNMEALPLAYPNVVPKVQGLYAMFGALDYCYGHKPITVPGSCSEYNAVENITSSWAMLNTSWPITITPLDSCDFSMGGEPWQALLSRNNTEYPTVNTLLTSYCWWKHFDDCNTSTSDILYDPTALYMSYNEDLLNMSEIKLKLDAKGGLFRDPNGRLTDVALSWKPNGLAAFHGNLSAWIIAHKI